MTSPVGVLHDVEPLIEQIEVRSVRTHEEFIKCVELECATWGEAFSEKVPATIFKISQRIGGVTAGAFTDDGALVGFVFGMTGVENGAIVHWSDMLAVRSDVQNHGIGRRLKEFQRQAVRQVGATRMYWTYDPLVARNAHFNLNRLGARVAEYVENMYGADTGSVVHSGFGTDRFIVDWDISTATIPPDDASAHYDAVTGRIDSAPLLKFGSGGERDDGTEQFHGELPAILHVEIPPDIFAVRAESAALASQLRESTRRAFQWALANNYSIRRFEHDDSSSRMFYVLTHAST